MFLCIRFPLNFRMLRGHTCSAFASYILCVKRNNPGGRRTYVKNSVPGI